LQNYYKKSECANKIHFILPFAGFCERNFGGNIVAESEITAFFLHVQATAQKSILKALFFSLARSL